MVCCMFSFPTHIVNDSYLALFRILLLIAICNRCSCVSQLAAVSPNVLAVKHS